MDIKGKLIIIGGAIDKGSFTEVNFNTDVSQNLNFFEKGILKRILSESRYGLDSKIILVTTASKIPQIVGEEYKKAFNYLGANNVEVLDIQKREEAVKPEVLISAEQADVVLFTGGDQLRLTSILGGTRFHKILLEKYRKEEFLYAGTSAGAAAASANMIYQGSSKEALLKGEIKITSGLGFINSVIIDTHFVKRGRIGRLFQAVVSNPMILGVGLGEDTGLLIKEGTKMEAIGSGLVILVDGKEVKDTNLTDVSLGDPISINNLVVHVMNHNDRYDLVNSELTIYKESMRQTLNGASTMPSKEIANK